MPVFKPFKAFRPSADDAKSFASRPFDVVVQQEADAENALGLSQFLKVTTPELFDNHLLGENRHSASNDFLTQMIDDGKFIQDSKECFYLYGQTFNERAQYGIIGCLSTDDYMNGLIKQHELTRVDKVSDRSQHILNTGFHTEPVFTAVRDNLDVDLIIQDCLLVEPLYSFVTSDGISHQFWMIDNDAKIRRLQYVFEHDVDSVYIADGHHRSAAANVVANELQTEASKLFVAAVFPMQQLKLKGYHRLVDLGDLEINDFLTQLRLSFNIVEVGHTPVFPTDQKSLGLLLNGMWFKLSLNTLPEGILEACSVFNSLIAKKILSIDNVRTTNRIEYLGEKKRVDAVVEGQHELTNKAFFTLCPLDISQLFSLSDVGYILPPKSTWFEPKLRSGLFLHSLTD